MTRNMNTTDRIVRAAVGLGLVGFAVSRRSWWAALGAYPLVTGVLGVDPLYSAMHISTQKNPVEDVADAITEAVA